MQFFSQFGQDQFIYENFFKDKKEGFFIEIGASDPEEGSNSLFFENLGWKGILVEPIKEDYEKLCNKRKAIIENSAIYNQSGNFKFLLCTGYTKVLSGLWITQDSRHLQRIQSEISQFGGESDLIDVECITLSELIKKHNISEIDYLSVDTEGSEFEILEGLEDLSIFPTCISVENNYNEQNVKELLEDFGYKLVVTLGCDDIYKR